MGWKLIAWNVKFAIVRERSGMISTSSYKHDDIGGLFSVVTSRQRCHGPGIALYMFSFYTWSNQSHALWFCDILLQLKLIACNYEKQSGWLVRWQRATFNREIRDSNVSQAIPVKRNFIFLTLSVNSGIVLWNVSRPPSSLTTPHNLCRWNVV